MAIATHWRSGNPVYLLPVFLLWAVVGCGQSGNIEVDTSSSPVRFVIDHAGWPRPFWWPRVTELAIGSKEDELLWQVRATSDSGELAHKLAFIYGKVPPGFEQVFPPAGKAPRALVSGRSYYVGAAGPRAVYRSVFALPISPAEAMHLRPGSPPTSQAEEPATQPASSRPSRISPMP